MPPLAQYGLTPGQIAEMEQRRAFETRVQEALSTLATYYHFRLKNRSTDLSRVIPASTLQTPRVLFRVTPDYGL